MNKLRIDADRWYRVTELEEAITCIDEPYIRPFYRCNIWHVRGSQHDLLVDSGLGAVSLRKHVPRIAERDLYAVASHSHFDHIGAAHEFDTCHIHAAEADILTAPDRERTLADAFLGDEMFEALPPAPFEYHSHRLYPPRAVQTLDDGDVFDLGNRQLEVIHTPGHSPGGIALWEAATATLISGDLIYDGPLIEDLYHSDLDDYARSMRRLRALPARVVHGGHFPSFSGAHLHALIDDWLRRHQR
ncbi:MBL fold metallo-hydrolase [Salinisphaera sp. SPP-AMP-43]|uniref:MBL fold metallo-hydrolase n=1 Tax=Salinisphaera sp. SPP-AMP-43 TaxID=3121288 RepID=UPI003C6E6D34